MKKPANPPVNPDDIKDIFSKIPEDLPLKKTPKASIDVRAFHEVLAPLTKYLANDNKPSDKDTSKK